MRLTCVFNKLMMMMMMIQTQTVYTDGRTACLQYNHSILQTSKLFTAFAIFGFRLLRVDYFLIYAELLFFMCPAGQSQTGRWRHTVLNMSVRRSVRPPVCPFVRLVVHYQTCEDDILTTNERISMSVDTVVYGQG